MPFDPERYAAGLRRENERERERESIVLDRVPEATQERILATGRWLYTRG